MGLKKFIFKKKQTVSSFRKRENLIQAQQTTSPLFFTRKVRRTEKSVRSEECLGLQWKEASHSVHWVKYIKTPKWSSSERREFHITSSNPRDLFQVFFCFVLFLLLYLNKMYQFSVFKVRIKFQFNLGNSTNSHF